MNVLYIHQYFTTRDGSGGTRSYEFARRLAAHGHGVTVLTGATSVPEAKGGGRVTRLKIEGMDVIAIRVGYSNYMGHARRAWAFFEFMLSALWEALWLRDIDAVYASSTPLTVGVIGRVAAARHGAAFVFELRDLWPEYIEDFGLSKSRILMGSMRALNRYLYSCAERIVVISDSMNRRVQALYRETRGKVVTIPMGADTGYGGPERFDVPRRSPDDFVVCYTGVLGFVNAVGWLLDVAARLKDKGVSFVIAGDGKMRPALEEKKKALGLDNVFFLGRINKKQALALVAGSGACAVTHRYRDEGGRVYINCLDSLTNKFFDYIAAGKPVIINHESESSAYVERYRCGVRVPFDDPDAAALEILRLKEDPDLARRLGANGRRLATEYFDRDKMASRCEEVLSEVVREAKGSPAWMRP